jgi:MoxR-like ATPase
MSHTDDQAIIDQLQSAYQAMKKQVGQVVVGQADVVDQLLIAVFCRGHALLEGVPGLAKTLLVATLSRVLELGFKRIQFTPDLMPADITGTDILDEDAVTGKRSFRFVHGPIFSNMILADEINRTPPKTQAALLEAMQERHVTVGESTFALPDPFFVLATQNPIEQEGTFPLPEAQLDRFMFNIQVGYPSFAEEQQIIRSVTGTETPQIDPILNGEQVKQLQELVKRIQVADHVIEYAAQLVRATRPKQPEAPAYVKEMCAWGAGPRAGIFLITAAKARAVLQGRVHATTEDVRSMAFPVLRHRILTTFNAEAAGIRSDQIIQMLLDEHKPKSDIRL